MTLPEIVTDGETLASIASIAASSIQHFFASRKAGEDATIRDYFEWLRRENHKETIQAIEETRGAIDAISSLITTVSLSAAAEIARLNNDEERRHRERMDWQTKAYWRFAAHLLDGFRIAGGRWVYSAASQYQFDVSIVNYGNVAATIIAANARVYIEGSDEPKVCPLLRRGKGDMDNDIHRFDAVEIAPNCGAVTLRCYCDTGDRPKSLHSIDLQLAQTNEAYLLERDNEQSTTFSTRNQ